METNQIAELREQLSGLQKSLEALNTELPVTAAPAGTVGKDGTTAQAEFDAGTARMKQLELRQSFLKMSTSDVKEMLGIQASKTAGAQADGELLNKLASSDPNVRKLLDTTGGAALIRQDLEPMLYALFVKRFPFWERVNKEPSNGLVHAYNQVTSYGDAGTMTETGVVTDDASTYARKTSNIAVIATRRGITLKEQFAVAQGGAPYNGLATELNNGIVAITHKLQKLLFQGNADTAAKIATDEWGLYDANGITGLRYLLGSPNAGASPVMVEKGAGSYIAGINQLVAQASDNGGNPSAILMTPFRHAEWVNELLATIRQAPGSGTQQGLDFGSVYTSAGPLPIVVVKGDSIGSYAINAVNKQDVFVLDEETVSVPWLGSDSITTLEIPVGVAGSLTRLYIMFIMPGLAVKAPLFNGKMRVNV